MLTLIKLAVAGFIGAAIMHPLGADSCSCKANAASSYVTPKVDTCQCKAKTP